MTNDTDDDANECDRLLGREARVEDWHAIGNTPPTRWSKLQWALTKKFAGDEGLKLARAEVAKAEQQIIRKHRPTEPRHAALTDGVHELTVATLDVCEAFSSRFDNDEKYVLALEQRVKELENRIEHLSRGTQP